VAILPLADDIEGIQLFREALARADYSSEGLVRAFGRKRAAARPGGSVLETLVKLFYLGAAVPPSAVAEALAPLSLERLEAMGVLESGEASVEIVQLGGMLVASDPEHETRRADRVPGPGKASKALAAVTLRSPVARALDMGTGSGVQALLLSRHADEVMATDLNPRALAFAAFNAALNGVTTIDLRAGSLFEPVAGEQFDLVVSNPPYVVSPDTHLAFRDGGLPGDSFSEAVVRQVPRLLREGGFAQVLVNWVVPPGELWSAPLNAWIEGSGCDAVLLHTSSWDFFEYAISWNSFLRGDPTEFGAAVERWLGHFRQQGIERLAGGVVVLRRRAGNDNWVLPLETPEPQPGASSQLRGLFEAQDFLRACDDEALLDADLALAEDHAVELVLRFGSAQTRHVTLARGLGLRAGLDEATMELLSRLGAGGTLRDAGGETAVPAARRLIELGFVVPRATRPS
jgi:SAM-dependent methyltransferase